MSVKSHEFDAWPEGDGRSDAGSAQTADYESVKVAGTSNADEISQADASNGYEMRQADASNADESSQADAKPTLATSLASSVRAGNNARRRKEERGLCGSIFPCVRPPDEEVDVGAFFSDGDKRVLRLIDAFDRKALKQGPGQLLEQKKAPSGTGSSTDILVYGIRIQAPLSTCFQTFYEGTFGSYGGGSKGFISGEIQPLGGSMQTGDFVYRWVFPSPSLNPSEECDAILTARTTYYDDKGEKLVSESDCAYKRKFIVFSACSVDIMYDSKQYGDAQSKIQRVEYDVYSYVFKLSDAMTTNVYHVNHMQKGVAVSYFRRSDRDIELCKREMLLLRQLEKRCQANKLIFSPAAKMRADALVVGFKSKLEKQKQKFAKKHGNAK
jgi:hypothetical protein